MMTVHEVSRYTGVSVRTLQYYDKIGLLAPDAYTESGYRLYGDAALEKLEQILLFRTLRFSLSEIRTLVSRPDFDRDRALEQQIRLLELQRESIDNLLTLARALRQTGGNKMDFSKLDHAKLEEYAREAREKWQDTDVYRDFEAKSKGRSKEAERAIAEGMMTIFADFGRCRESDPASHEAQELVERLRSYISAYYYTCTPEILGSLGQMYAAGGEMTDNIDAAGGAGTADFAGRAIALYCASR